MSDLNKMRFFSIGKAPTDWKNSVPAPLFVKKFVITKKASADIIISATGFYELYLNKKRITKGYLAPYVSNPDQVLFFDTYKLNEELRLGENELCVLLGNGASNPFSAEIWNHDKQKIGPALALEFRCGELSFSAEDMGFTESNILFDDMRSGVLCDMTRNVDCEVLTPSVISKQPLGERRFTSCEPICEIRRIRAKRIRQGALRDYRMRDCFVGRLYNKDTVMGKSPLSGGYIYDFGENTAGVPRLRINGKRGQKIEMQFCELMHEGFADYINTDIYPDGCAQRDVYICSGDGYEEFIPPFTYHGARYCYVYGIEPDQATEELIEFIVLRNGVEVKAHFNCSDRISNEIFAACRRSEDANLMNIITDCPAREKNGWTGDAAISAEHYLFNLGAESCMADYLACVRAAMDDRGGLPLVVPSSQGANDCPIWDSVLAFCSYYTYKYRGKIDILRDNAPYIMKNLRHHLSNTDERGISECGLGDWLPVGLDAGEYHSPLGFCNAAVLMEICKLTENIARVLEDTESAEYCREQYGRLRESSRREYLDGGLVTAGKTERYRKPLYRPCQTSQTLALQVGMFNKDEEKEAIEHLIAMINDNGGAFDSGFLGLRYLFRVLSRFGYDDLAYKMITRPEHPSYANMIYRGETTVPERFCAPGERMGSHNHHFMADVSAWYLECVLGIHVNPHLDDANHILLEPSFISALEYCEGSYKTPNGEIFVRWERNGENITLKADANGEVSIEYGEKLCNNKLVHLFVNGEQQILH